MALVRPRHGTQPRLEPLPWRRAGQLPRHESGRWPALEKAGPPALEACSPRGARAARRGDTERPRSRSPGWARRPYGKLF
jgi:hypothetical protein